KAHEFLLFGNPIGQCFRQFLEHAGYFGQCLSDFSGIKPFCLRINWYNACRVSSELLGFFYARVLQYITVKAKVVEARKVIFLVIFKVLFSVWLIKPNYTNCRAFITDHSFRNMHTAAHASALYRFYLCLNGYGTRFNINNWQ